MNNTRSLTTEETPEMTRKPISQRRLHPTPTDRAILDLTTRTGGATAAQIHRYLGLTSTKEAMHHRLNRLTRAGLMTNYQPLRDYPGLYLPKGVAGPGVAVFEHRLGVVDLYVDAALGEVADPASPVREVISEVEIAAADAVNNTQWDRLVRSGWVPVYKVPVRTGPGPVGGPVFRSVHAPDLSLVLDRPESGPVRQVAVEYERTPKARVRVLETVRSYDVAARLGHVAQVRWVMTSQTDADRYAAIIGEASVVPGLHHVSVHTPRWAFPRRRAAA